MPGAEDLALEVMATVEPGSNGNLLARGQSRALVWRRGLVPRNGPKFAKRLSYDLMSYAFGLASNALALLSEADEDNDLSRPVELAFERAAEAMEAVLRDGDPEAPDRDMNIAIAAMCYHLAGYSARAYSLVDRNPIHAENDATAYALSRLMLRDLDALSKHIGERIPRLISLLDSPSRSDEPKLSQSETPGMYDETIIDPRFHALDLTFMQAMSLMLTGLDHGARGLFDEARASLARSATLAADHGFVLQWWTHRLASHLLEGLWNASLHARVPRVPPHSDAAKVSSGKWHHLRDAFITRLRARARAEVELWPSQLPGAAAVLESDADLVLSMPTSAGKTRIAELAILRVLARDQRIIFVTPLKALSSQTEHNLRKLFVPLGYSVSALYGPMGVTPNDGRGLASSDLVVATPEKFDFALRKDEELLGNVGLIVFDEGHMIGPGQREVRYEAQIQRLLNRSDAAGRRILCLSAVLPEGDALADFADWFTGEGESGLIRTDWTPTRRRFGLVELTRAGSGRMELTVGGEKPFIPQLFPQGTPVGRRKSLYPNDQPEMTLATAAALIGRDHTVLIYSPRKASVLALAKRIPSLHRQRLLDPVPVNNQPAVDEAVRVAEELFGPEDVVTQCLRLGVGLHHGSLPTQYRHHVERLIRENALRLVIASPTLAQGINLSATTVVFHGIFGLDGGPMPTADFLNVIGRAGRAFADVEGLVLFPVLEHDGRKRRTKLDAWDMLQTAASEHTLRSGIVEVVRQVVSRIQRAVPEEDAASVVEFVLNQQEISSGTGDDDAGELAALIALIDVSLLSLLGGASDDDDVTVALEKALKDSLWSRSLSRLPRAEQLLYPEVLKARAGVVWRETTAAQRRGMFLAGIGLQTERLLAEREAALGALYEEATTAIETNDNEAAVAAITALAALLFEIPPFTPASKHPTEWEAVLAHWLSGGSLNFSDPTATYAAYDFIEDSVGFNLSWGLESVRSRLAPEERLLPEKSVNWVALAVQTGSLDRAAMMLLQAGLPSRSVAHIVAKELSPTVTSFATFNAWLASSSLQAYSERVDKPTPSSHSQWVDFLRDQSETEESSWSPVQRSLPVLPNQAMPVEVPVRLARGNDAIRGADSEHLGRLAVPFSTAAQFWRAWTTSDGTVRVEEWH